MTRRKWIYPADGEPYEVSVDYSPPPRVHVMGDIQPYQSMVTGEMIKSRSHHREHISQHRLIEYGNEKIVPKPPPIDRGDRKRLIAEIVQAKK